MIDVGHRLKWFLVSCLLAISVSSYAQIDALATAETSNLYASLQTLSSRKLLVGHQHTTAYGVWWEDNNLRSDIKDVTGAFPALYGWGFWHTGVGYKGAAEYDYLAQLMREAYERGGVNTMVWHMENPVTGSDAWDTSTSMESILPGGANHGAFVAKLATFADFMLNLTDSTGTPIPVIFRPFHESNGTWFWWGSSTLSNAQYIELWQFTVDYLRDTRGVHNLLYAYAPDNCYGNTATYLARYPGDSFVDILGKDHYFSGLSGSPYWLSVANLLDDLNIVGTLAADRGKVAALTEFGYRNSSDFGLSYCPDPNWFMTKLLNPLKADAIARRISYCLAWRNANNAEYPGHYFVPYPGQQNDADFNTFKDDSYTMFGDTMPNVYGTIYPLTYRAGTGGSISGSTPQLVDWGSDGDMVSAVPNAGYRFLDWSDGVIEAIRTDTAVTGPVDVTANFYLNNPPTIDSAPWAQSDPVILPESTTVYVIASDIDGNPLTYTWTTVSGPVLATIDPNGTESSDTSIASFDMAGDYVLEVTVSDGLASVSDTLSITVLSASSVPTARAGVDQIVVDSDESGTETVLLDGSASTDSDGSIVSYVWTKDTVPVAAGATPAIDLGVGTHTLALTVTDDDGASDTDTVVITVNTPTNTVPVVSDGAVTTTRGTSVPVTLEASDADGDVLTYIIVDSPAHGLLTGTAPNLRYIPDRGYVGADSVTFKVYDGTVESPIATVSITVEYGIGSRGCRVGPTADYGALLPLLLMLGVVGFTRRRAAR